MAFTVCIATAVLISTVQLSQRTNFSSPFEFAHAPYKYVKVYPAPKVGHTFTRQVQAHHDQLIPGHASPLSMPSYSLQLGKEIEPSCTLLEKRVRCTIG